MFTSLAYAYTVFSCIHIQTMTQPRICETRNRIKQKGGQNVHIDISKITFDYRKYFKAGQP